LSVPDFSQLATYLAFFSVTYLATSLKLAKFSVTERTAGLAVTLALALTLALEPVALLTSLTQLKR